MAEMTTTLTGFAAATIEKKRAAEAVQESSQAAAGTAEYTFDVSHMDLFYNEFQALKDINMKIKKNEITALIGPSGCGKSTFLKTLNRMNDWVEGCRVTGEGHSDRLVIADGNFPVMSMGKNAQIIRMDGHGVPEILDAILKVFPLDTYIEKPVNLMEVMPGDDVQTPIWDVYKKTVEKYDERGKNAIGEIERFKFYEETKTAYAVIATSEKALYANIMLQKGVV